MRATVVPPARSLCSLLAFLLLAGTALPLAAADMKLQGFLLWGTDETKPPAGKKYTQARPEIRERLKGLPFARTNWYEVKSVVFSVQPKRTNDVVMSEKCQLKVRHLGGSELEVVLVGKGKEVVRQKQALPKGETLLLGGNAPNSTCWMVLLKRIE
jgi:hypothetical protein